MSSFLYAFIEIAIAIAVNLNDKSFRAKFSPTKNTLNSENDL